ncbi:MAG: hypothetical protein U1E87_06760 [Alphaproteobacteria bacterium]
MLNCVARLACLLAVAVLGACATRNSDDEPCPVSGVLGEAETRTTLASGSAQVSDIVQRVTVSGAKLSCSYRGKKGLVSSISFDITVENGPTAAAGSADVPYFVAVSRGKSILARQTFARRIDMGKKARETVRERVGMIKIPFAEGTTGASYTVVVGLVLTPEELAYNRERRGQ